MQRMSPGKQEEYAPPVCIPRESYAPPVCIPRECYTPPVVSFPVEVPEPLAPEEETEEWEDRYQSVHDEQIKIYDEEEKIFNEV